MVRQSKRNLTYHGRKGKPMIHETESDRKYIMVRARKVEGSGTKRLYLDSHGNVPAQHRQPVKHRI